ncbi:glycosyltransferase [Mycolicibacterium diernhoferi]|uniref:Glycosyl transferase n=1 Tax=Mycolicibacterium diernhoferi TaxID=1801 RepID=A0A1Q4HFV1_9MYCO|nr:glycosyltransferase [Mycolicibacterium diernhoferi]OJZ66393.1 glycosyl transferase [Mycolicibacterium diernhoferi]OPE54877.1 glycosyl transferase [Mycolicibacterium diernhoferi]PEG54192.1 glycosyltransferase [Mycolicibacterium diernhoferi]QYL24563.1 glycosyltransferase [Mycolicibacterium diernhoferi]
MSTILAYTSPSLGNLYPIAALLSELHRRGHRIVLRTHTAGLPVGRGAGFDVAAVDPRVEAVAMTDWMARTGWQGIKTGFGVFAERAALEVGDLQAAIAAERPDALVIDTNCWGASAVAEATGLPWASFWPYPPYLSSPAVPPFGLGLRPRADLFGRLRDRGVATAVGGLLDRSMITPLGRVYRELGIRPISSADDFVRRAPLMLVATAEPFEYPRPDWGDRVVLIGPCELGEPPVADGPDTGPAPDDDRPVVLVTTSSEHQRDDVLPTTALAALADEPMRVVATYPCGIPEGLDIPDNATVHGFAAHGRWLDHAVCAVTHGGMGVTQKALARGVPVCAVPFGRDQFEVARRIEISRSGTRLVSRRLTAPRLRAKVLEAMAMTDGARRVAAGFAAAGGARRGADVLERRLLGIAAAGG